MSNGGFVSEEQKTVSESLRDLLILTTMCIVGFPVDVQVKDGSVYSGIFYTACFDDDYAVVLKTARMMKKGNHKANVPYDSLIDTLVIQADDLVQVVAKDIQLPEDGIPGESLVGDACCLAAVTPHDVCRDVEEYDTKSTTGSSCNNCRSLPFLSGESLTDGRTEGMQSDFSSELKSPGAQESDEFLSSRSSADAFESRPNSPESNNKGAEADKFSDPSFKKSDGMNTNGSKHERPSVDYDPHPDALSSSVSASGFLPTSTAENKSMPPKSAKVLREFKLNPKAKVFSPSSVLRRPATPTLVAPASLHAVPIAASAGSEIVASSFAYPSSTPAIHLPHSNLVNGRGDGDQQYSKPILALAGGRTQPVRYAAQYGHLQPGIAYMHQNSQNATARRLGPCIYVHPVCCVTIPGYNLTSETLDPAHPSIMGAFPVSSGSLVTKSV